MTRYAIDVEKVANEAGELTRLIDWLKDRKISTSLPIEIPPELEAEFKLTFPNTYKVRQ